MKLLLDTHIWLWSLLEPDRLGLRVRELLVDPDNTLWLSPISVWELQMLVEKGRVVLDQPLDEWLDQALERAPLREAPLTIAVAQACRAIETPHKDPADRFLAATARALDLTLVTADELLRRGRGFSSLPNA